MEAGANGSGEIDRELTRIEEAVASGDRDLGALGFWRIVAAVKRDPALSVAHAPRIGRIDTAAFRAGVKLRVPVWVGNLVLGVAALGGVAALMVACALEDPLVVGVLVVAAGLVWTVALHSPAHWLVGWLAGMRFTDYFLGGGIPPRPGIKIDYVTYLRVEPSMRAWMHASGAIGTKVAPFAALAFSPWDVVPLWAVVTLLAVGAVMIATDLIFSVRSGDWKRFLRERRIARAIG